MDELKKPPQWLIDLLPEARGFLEGGGWLAILGVGGLLLLLLLWLAVVRPIRGLFRHEPEAPRVDPVAEDLSAIPPAPPHSGDVRLTVEGIPVRLRLVVMAPAGTAYTLAPELVPALLDRVVPGLADAVKRDSPEIRIWPGQLSTDGFAHSFHRNTPIPEGERKPSRWVLLAGRADLGERQVMVGLALQTIKPHTIGRRTLKPHDWAMTLRVKVMET
jgi:hypothetical protein